MLTPGKEKDIRYHKILLLVFGIVFIWSLISPKDYFTWFLEVLPAITGVLVLILTFKRFSFTNLTYALILLHCCILMVGGHYTYAEMPLFDWIKEVFHQSRNNYDKVGHFAQGFVPAIISRELLIRKNVINGKGWLHFIVLSLCMSMSAAYEFIEWFAALIIGEAAESFLGTQGYVWDTQSDMLYATIGAIAALILLSKVHDKKINEIAGYEKDRG
jgi:putative membrane protein